MIGKSTQNVVNKLKVVQEYKEMEDAADVLFLVKLLKTIVYNFEEQKNVVDALFAVDSNFQKNHQRNDISNDDYY